MQVITLMIDNDADIIGENALFLPHPIHSAKQNRYHL
jgi:hypothetical protein